MRLVPETNTQKLSGPGLTIRLSPEPGQPLWKGIGTCLIRTVTTPEPAWAAFIGLDWGSQKHAWILQPAGGGKREQGVVDNTPEAIADWAADLIAASAANPSPSPWNRSVDRS